MLLCAAGYNNILYFTAAPQSISSTEDENRVEFVYKTQRYYVQTRLWTVYSTSTSQVIFKKKNNNHKQDKVLYKTTKIKSLVVTGLLLKGKATLQASQTREYFSRIDR